MAEHNSVIIDFQECMLGHQLNGAYSAVSKQKLHPSAITIPKNRMMIR